MRNSVSFAAGVVEAQENEGDTKRLLRDSAGAGDRPNPVTPPEWLFPISRPRHNPPASAPALSAVDTIQREAADAVRQAWQEWLGPVEAPKQPDIEQAPPAKMPPSLKRVGRFQHEYHRCVHCLQAPPHVGLPTPRPPILLSRSTGQPSSRPQSSLRQSALSRPIRPAPHAPAPPGRSVHDAFDLAARFLVPSASFSRQLRMAAQITVAVFATSLIATFQKSSAALNNKGLWSVVTGAYGSEADPSGHARTPRRTPRQPLAKRSKKPPSQQQALSHHRSVRVLCSLSPPQ